MDLQSLEVAADADSGDAVEEFRCSRSGSSAKARVDPLVEALWPDSIAGFPVWLLRQYGPRRLARAMTGHRLRDNALLNKWEFAQGKTRLQSYPWRLSVPFVLCNAQCDFCAAWLMQGKSSIIDLIEALIPAIRNCSQLDLVGWGEPLIHPEFEKILTLIRRECHADARLALTTNGTRLAQWVDRLIAANVKHYAVSIHAAREETHRDLMGFGAGVFERVKDGIRALVARKADHPDVDVEAVLLVTRQNIAEIPDFLDMCVRLGVDRVHLRTLMPQHEPREGLDYHRLPPYLHPDYAVLREKALEAVAACPLPVRAQPHTWSEPVFSAQWEPRLESLPVTTRKSRFVYPMVEHRWEELGSGQPIADETPQARPDNRLGREAPLYCPSPYTAFYVNGTDRRVIPCVYMHKVPDHELIHFKPGMAFQDVWNSPAMVAVRHHLNHGPLMPDCLKCPFYC